MATITYDGLAVQTNMVTFSDVPNILKIKEVQSGEAFWFVIIVRNARLNPTEEGQYYITLFGDTITSTLNPQTANNKLFWISYDSNNSQAARAATAASITKALRNCNNIIAAYDVWQEGTIVNVKAKSLGFVASNVSDIYKTNIPIIPTRHLYTEIVHSGSTSTDLYGAKIQADIYIDTEFKTNLEKQYYGDEVSFDVSPVLASYSEFGKLTPYNIKLSKIGQDGSYSTIGDVISGDTICGYQANNSSPYIFKYSTPQVMGYVGEDCELQLCGGVELSLLTSSSLICKVIGIDGDGNESFLHTITAYTHNGVAEVKNDITEEELQFTDKVIFSAGTGVTLEYKVIKPIRAAEDVERVCWRNEYGGVWFYDFTAKRQETFAIDTDIYKKNNFDFYTAEYEQDKILSTREKKTIRLTSHLLPKNAIWIFNSLARSRKVWVYQNNKKVYIIPKGLDVVEDGNYNDIYTATLTYNYSYEK